MSEELIKLIDEMLKATENDSRYGTWVVDAQDKNIDIRIYTIVDLRNWLKSKPKETNNDQAN